MTNSAMTFVLSPELEGRYLDKFEVDDECWNWVGSMGKGGYGRLAVGPNRHTPAHRFSYERLVGPIPDGLVIDHLCRNRRCVRPSHLEPVTNRVNVVVRGVGGAADKARRTHCPRGHDYTPDNTYVDKKNRRYCRSCQRTWLAAYEKRRPVRVRKTTIEELVEEES